jgi:Domain of unknown function (DUF1918)
VPAKKSTDRKASVKKATVKKATAKKTTSKKATVKKATVKKATVKKSVMPARHGDLIVIDSAKVGSPPREGEILEVIQGEVSVSYRVKWDDGHQTFITPALGVARIVPASQRA